MSNTNNLKTAVEKTPDVKGHYKPGLQAVKNSAKYIVCREERLITGSVYIDKATEHLYPEANRWDYVIEFSNLLYYVEPHPADADHQVDKVCAKARWLFWWLKNRAPEIGRLRSAGLFWVQTGKNTVLKDSRQKRKLAVLGVKIACPLKLNS